MVNRLRERQGLRVELRPSANGGVTAAVLIPEGLMRDGVPAATAGRTRGPAPAAGLLPGTG
ncbi:hypothetical protein ACFWIO_21855 [Streptomyces diastatochromogenes]|uniref:hypothetical protein n=1 Tax=Streptomyces diastatochromogenes TaxID=42236 RepID=UPI0036665933